VPVALAVPRLATLVWRRSEGGQQCLVDGCLERGADVQVDQSSCAPCGFVFVAALALRPDDTALRVALMLVLRGGRLIAFDPSP
jgi:hypothetical protein